MSCGELRRVEKSCENLKSWGEMRWEETREAQVTWEAMRTVVISGEELRMGEKTWDGMRWDAVKKLRQEMRWDDTDCGDSGMQWAISKRSCDAMRSNEMRKDSTFERHGIRLKVKRLLLRSTGGLPVTYRHSLCSALWAISVSNLKLPPLACPGTTCIFIHTHIYIYINIYNVCLCFCFSWSYSVEAYWQLEKTRNKD